MHRLATAATILLLMAVRCLPQASAGSDFYPQAGPSSPLASTTPPEKRCVIAGHVTNALTGEPLKKTYIRLTSRGGSNRAVIGTAGSMVAGAQAYTTSTAADGSFRMEGIEPGEYILSGTRSGFLNTQYGAKAPGRPGTSISLSPGQQVSDISLSLSPQAVITGKVVDEDGDPVGGGMAQVLRQRWLRGKLRYLPERSGPINDLGEFRIANVEPGKYYVAAQKTPNPQEAPPPGQPDTRAIRTFYPGAAAIADATLLDVKTGQDLAGINIRLITAQTYHVRGKVIGSVSEGTRERTMVSLSARADDSAVFTGGQTGVGRDGTFDVAGVMPGAYTLTLMTMSGQVRMIGHQNVDVGAADVNDVAVAVTPPGSMRGVARVEGTAPSGVAAPTAASLRLAFIPLDSTPMMGPVSVAKFAPDGTFTIENVSPGKYFVQTAAPQGTYLRSVRFGSAEIQGKELDLSSGVGGQLEVIYRYGPAEVSGTVQSEQAGSGAVEARSVPPAQILLVPDVLNADGSGTLFGNSDNTGAYTVSQVPPGHYRAYAFERLDTEQLQNPDVLKQLESVGQNIEVKENEKKQIQLALISADALVQVLLRAGIETQ